MIKLSVIVPARNRRNNLVQTLLALREQTLAREEWEFVLSDDNSSDRTSDLLSEYKENFQIRYVFNNHKKGSWNASTPRNLGAFVSSPEALGLVFLDSDIILPKDALKNYLEDIVESSKRVVIGSYHWLKPIDTETIKSHILNQNDFHQFFFSQVSQPDVRQPKFEKVTPHEEFTLLQDGLACFGGNLCIPRNIFFQLGGYDDDTHIGLEDGEMGIRMWKAGVPFSYDNRIVGYHQYHEIPPDRFPPNMKEHIDRLNRKHFNTEDPDFNLINESKKAYAIWGIESWEVPPEWLR